MIDAKKDYRALFLALQADAKSFPGGISGLADVIGATKETLANNLNPDSESPPPSFAKVLEIINQAQAKRAVFALAQLVGQVPMDFAVEHKSQKEAVKTFLSLISSASDLFGKGAEFAKDNDFSLSERRAMQPMLLALMKTTCELMYSIQE